MQTFKQFVVESTWNKRTYLEANCFAMGLAIQQTLGWPLSILYFGKIPTHVVAKNPQGGYADVRGPNLTKAQVLDGLKPLVSTWKPSIKPATSAQISVMLDKKPSPGLVQTAKEDLERFWGKDILDGLKS